MKKVYITLVLTLLFVVAYLGTAHGAPVPKAADSSIPAYAKVTPRANPAFGKKTVSKEKAKAETTSVVAKEEPAKEKKVQTGSEENEVRLSGTTSTDSIAKLDFEVKLNKEGYYVEAKDAGCATCEKISRPLNFNHSDLDPNGSEEAQLKASAIAILRVAMKSDKINAATVKTRTAEEKRAERKEKALQAKKDSCEVNESGEKFDTQEGRASCFDTRITALLESSKDEDHDKALTMLDTAAKFYEKDVLAGKTNSPFVKMFADMASIKLEGDVSIAKRNFAVITQATMANTLYVNGRNDIQKQIEYIKSLADSGQFEEAAKQRNALVTNAAPMMKKLSDSAITQVGFVSKLSSPADLTGFSVNELKAKYPEVQNMIPGMNGQIADIAGYKMYGTDLSVASQELGTYISSAPKRGIKQASRSASSKFGYSVTDNGNTAAESATGSTVSKYLATDEELARILGSTRGSMNGSIPSGIPQNPAVIGLGGTALAANITGQPLAANGLNNNGLLTSRMQGGVR